MALTAHGQKLRKNLGSVTTSLFKSLTAAVLLLPIFAQAQGSTSSSSSAQNKTTAKTEKMTEATPKKVTVSFTLSRTHSLYDYRDGTSSASQGYALSAGLTLEKNWSLSGGLQAYQDLKDSSEGDIGGGAISITRKNLPFFIPALDFALSMPLAFPLSKDETYATRSSYLGTVGLKAVFSVKPDSLFSKRFSLSAGIGASRNFHTYEQWQSGRSNNKWGTSESFSMGWSFTDSLRASAGISHFNKWTYSGTQREYISHFQSIDYGFNENLAVSLSHSWGNPAVSYYKADGKTALELSDESNSFVGGAMTVTF